MDVTLRVYCMRNDVPDNVLVHFHRPIRCSGSFGVHFVQVGISYPPGVVLGEPAITEIKYFATKLARAADPSLLERPPNVALIGVSPRAYVRVS